MQILWVSQKRNPARKSGRLLGGTDAGANCKRVRGRGTKLGGAVRKALQAERTA